MHLEQRLKVVFGLMPTRALVLQPMPPWLQQHMPFKSTQLEIHEPGSIHAGRNSRSLLHISLSAILHNSRVLAQCSAGIWIASTCAEKCRDDSHTCLQAHIIFATDWSCIWLKFQSQTAIFQFTRISQSSKYRVVVMNKSSHCRQVPKSYPTISLKRLITIANFMWHLLLQKIWPLRTSPPSDAHHHNAFSLCIYVNG